MEYSSTTEDTKDSTGTQSVNPADKPNKLAEEAMRKATLQLMSSTEFKKRRMERITKFYALYDGKTQKKLRQMFNVAIPVFPGMVDTLCAQYDTPIQVKFKEGDASDYFKVKKLNGAFDSEVMDTSQNSKWDSKLRMARNHAIMTGRAIVRYTVSSDPEYMSEMENVNAKYFHCQPRGGQYLEKHLFCGEENIDKTKEELEEGVKSGLYNKEQVADLISRCSNTEYLPENNIEMGQRLQRFKPLNLNPDNNNYVGEPIYKLAEWILRVNGIRYYLLFHPWSRTWLRFEKWKDIDSSNLLPWKSYATHPDDENFWSKGYADDLYPSADAIVAMFNQELTNREKRNFGARAYDKDMFTDVRKLDESMSRPDALIPADTKGGTRQISQGIYEFKVGELNGTVNLIDWITGSIGRSTGANDLSQGEVKDVSKKASVTFAEQKSVSKRLGWGAQPFQEFMGDLGKAFIWGLKDHMPAKMAIRILGENGWDWDQITRLDLNTTKDVDILILSTDKEIQESELKIQNRKAALDAIGVDPALSGVVNPQKRVEELLRSVGRYDDNEVAEFLDTKTYSDKKALSKAAESIQLILQNQTPVLWYGANTAFMQKIVDFASDNRSTLKEKFDVLIEYATAHAQIVQGNMARKAQEDARAINQSRMMNPDADPNAGKPSAPAGDGSPAVNPGISGGMSRAMQMGASV